MKNLGENLNDYPQGNRALLPIILGAIESLILGFSFYLGFILAFLLSPNPTYLAPAEILLMSIGAAFSYAFIFVLRQNHHREQSNFSLQLPLNLLGNISCAYILHLAILFMVKDSGFSSIRMAIGLGYVISCLGILAVRFISAFFANSHQVREGKKKIIIKGIESSVYSNETEIEQFQLSRKIHKSRNMTSERIIGHPDRIKGFHHKDNLDDRTNEVSAGDSHAKP